MSICAVIIAADESIQMKSKKCKFIQKAGGKPVILWVKEALDSAGASEQVYIVGHLQEQVRQTLGEEVAFMLQDKQLGSAHAVLQASPFLEGRKGLTLVLKGDMPLITESTIREILDFTAHGEYAAVKIVSAAFESAVSNETLSAGLIDSEIYCFDTALLVSVLGRMCSVSNQKEYCLSKAFEILSNDGRKIGKYEAPAEELSGVQDKFQLMQVSKLLNRRICRQHMQNGVTIADPDTTWIEASVIIGQDTEVLPNTTLEGETIIGEDCIIGPQVRIADSIIGREVVIFNSIVAASNVNEGSHIGPFSYIRQDSVIGAHTRIGHSVEVKNSNVGAYGKALNMAQIADADLSENVNYGCGCITVNFDGNFKSRTKIGENSFVGSNSNLIAPVQVSDNTYIAAGSTITDDVPPYGMAIARSHQIVKEEWVLKKNRVRLQNKNN